MVTRDKDLCFSPHIGEYINPRQPACYRFRLTSYHAFWLASRTLWRCVRSDRTPLETSGVALLSSLYHLTLRFVSFRKGVLWLLLATMAEVPPVVSLSNSSITPSR